MAAAKPITADDLLVVQDLDGVCMQLVKDPLTRRIETLLPIRDCRTCSVICHVDYPSEI